MPRIVSTIRAVLLAIAVIVAGVRGPLAASDRSPRLIVLLTVDQMRGDYIDKLGQQWTRGLHRLATQGAWFKRADYSHYNTVTCVGHASISTGAVPAIHGMVLNTWWDRDARKAVNCTDDESAKIISYGKPVISIGESLVRLRTTTLADELRMQLSPASRVISFSIKARAAATLGGLRPYAVTWFDDDGAWVTSSAFAKAPVPEVAEFIARNPVENDFGKVWDRALPRPAYLYEDSTAGFHSTKAMANTFPHALKGASASPDATFYQQWQTSPYPDEYLARMALSVAERMKIGKTASTDMIAVSFSALDKVGHDYGPDSHEAQDTLIRLDRALGDLFSGLDRLIGADNYTVALSADHGVAPLPERAAAEGIDAGKIAPATIVGAAEQAIARMLGPGTYVDYFAHTDLFLAPGIYERLRAQPAGLETLRAALRAIRGVREVYTRDQLAASAAVDDAMARQLARSYYPERSGDLAIGLQPYWIAQIDGTTHGTGYAYDTHVPVVLMGKGIARGEYLQPANPTDIAPTLAFLAGVTLPRVSGRVLTEALTAIAARSLLVRGVQGPRKSARTREQQ